MTDSVLCAADELAEFTTKIFTRLGMPEDDAAYMSANIISSELTGHECHGMRRVPEYVGRWREGKANPVTDLQVEKDGGSTLLLNAQGAFGHVVMRDAIKIAIARAKASGVSVVGIRRSEHAGRYADFCMEAADQGVITLIFANDSGGCQQVAPPGGLAPRLSTNPLAIGIPRTGKPHFVLDMATSAAAFGRVSDLRDRGESVPSDWLNSCGKLLPFGGLKGFGLSIVVEALAGALTGAGTVRECPEKDDQAILIIAIDVEHMRPLSDFVSDVDAFMSYIKDVPLEDGAPPVRMPGETGALRCAEIKKRGIEVQGFVREKLLRIAEELKVGVPATLCAIDR